MVSFGSVIDWFAKTLSGIERDPITLDYIVYYLERKFIRPCSYLVNNFVRRDLYYIEIQGLFCYDVLLWILLLIVCETQ